MPPEWGMLASRGFWAWCEWWRVWDGVAMDEVVTARGGWLRGLALALRRVPLGALLAQRAYQLTQPRYTMGVVGVLLDETRERVLLVEHVFHAVHPWGLPGGWLARGEDPAQGVVREFREETGLRVRAVRPLLIERAPGMPRHMDAAYLCALDGAPQEIRLSRELLNARWVPCRATPSLVAFQRAALRAALDGRDGQTERQTD